MLKFFRTPLGFAVSSVLLLAGAGYLALGLRHLEIDNDVRNFTPGSDPNIKFCDRIDETFGSADAILVGLDGPDRLTVELLAVVRSITRELEERYEDVVSVASADTIVVEGTTLKPQSLLEDGPVTARSLDLLQERLADWDMFDKTLVSSDGKAPAVMVNVPHHFSVEQREGALTDIRETVARHVSQAGLDVKTYIAGEPVISLEVGERVADDLTYLSPLALLVVLIVLVITLRTFGGVVGPILTVAIAVAATFGLMGWLGTKVMIVSSAVPVFLVAVGSAYGIHIAAHFRRNLLGGMARAEAASATMRQVGGAVATAAFTTVAGFYSLSFSDIVPVHDFGLFLAIGVAIALVASLTVVPLLLLPGRRLVAGTQSRGQPTGDEENPGPLGDMLGRLSAWAVRRRVPLVVVTSLITLAVAAAATATVRVDQDTVSLFPEDSMVRQADEFLCKRFAGTHTLSVVITGPEQRAMLAPEILQFMADLQNELEEDKNVGKTSSLADLVRRMNLVMHRGEQEFDTIPESQALVAQYIQLYELSGDPEDFSTFVDFEYRQGQVMVQMRTGSAEKARRLRERVADFSDKQLPDSYQLQLAGTLTRYDIINLFIVHGQLISLAMSLVTVFLMVGVLFYRRKQAGAGTSVGRRLLEAASAGLLTLLPIVTAVSANFGTMTLLDIPLDVATALIAACAVGIGIDYSVHFLHRYNAGLEKGLECLAAITWAARTSGKPIVFNAAAVSAGFLTLLLSDFASLISMAWLTALTMVVTSLAALTLLPAWLYIRDGGKGATSR